MGAQATRPAGKASFDLGIHVQRRLAAGHEAGVAGLDELRDSSARRSVVRSPPDHGLELAEILVSEP